MPVRGVLTMWIVCTLVFITGFVKPVTNINGRPISATAPTAGEALVFDGTHWAPSLAGGGVPAAHAASHQDTGTDEISVAGLSGVLQQGQKMAVLEEGSPVGTRPNINFIGGTVTVTDNAGTNSIDVTVADSGIDGTMVANRVPYGLDVDTLQTSANLTFDGSVLTLGGRQTITAGTFGTGVSALGLTATMPASSASEVAVGLTVTGAGTGVVAKRAVSVNLLPGYTDAGLSEALGGYNSGAGTGSDLNLTTATVGLLNVGTTGFCDGTTAGASAGVQAVAINSALSIGVLAKADGSITSIGVLAATETGAADQIGVYAALSPADNPTFTGLSAAVLADNTVVAVPIIVAQDNSVTKWQIIDKGYELHTLGTLVTSGDKIYNATVTMPAGAGSEKVWQVDVTSAGSGVVGKRGAAFNLLPGYTDAGLTVPLEAFNTAAGTGNTLRLSTADAEPLGNLGAGFFSSGVTAGANVGAIGEAVNATGKNVGIIGKAISGAATQNIGVLGAANGATANVGVYAGLAPGADLTLTSSALLVDNNAVAANIVTFRDNGTIVGEIEDGGVVKHSIPSAPGGTISLFEITGTIAGSGSSNQFGLDVDITPTSTAGFDQAAGFFRMNSGGASVEDTYGLYAFNQATNTAATAFTLGAFTEAGVNGVFGAFALSTSAADQNGIGAVGRAANGPASGNVRRIGVLGEAVSENAESTAVGVIGNARLSGAVAVGGYFGLHVDATPTFTSAALIADNAVEAVPIFLARDNGTAVVGIEDGGNVGIGSTAAANPGAKLDVADGGTGAAALRLRVQAAPTSPNDGDEWNDSTQKAPTVRSGGNTQTLDRTLFTMTSNSTVTNIDTEASVFGTGVGTRTAAANYFVAGKTARITLGGVISTDTITPGNLTLRVKLGGSTLVDTGTFAVGANLSNVAWEIDIDLTNQTTGGSGTFGVSGRYTAAELLTTVRSASLTHAGTPTADTTAANLIEVTVQWDTADADNKFVTTTGVVQGLN